MSHKPAMRSLTRVASFLFAHMYSVIKQIGNRLLKRIREKSYWEGYHKAYAGAALMTDMSPDHLILGYHNALSKTALLKDLHDHFMSSAKSGLQNMQSA